eukprot:TRINITY_DN2841_c0_g1_i3.p1 TRINITY_DN2841_c0_g1~~TRINITY_DN2841_c0_g1_i3.p1  ORF type:complete len:745 (-),score=104.28 TRINITY_DN2841_c0_g1_i3:547-2781(-)
MSTDQNPMLGLQNKKNEIVDITNPIYQHCKTTYGAQEADSILEELQVLQKLRDQIVGQTGSAHAQKKQYIKYFQGLLALELRFVIGKEKEKAKISFMWYDAFKTSKRVSQNCIQFEKAAVLFNLAAACTQIGNLVSRRDDDGVKEACNNFQEAAGYLDSIQKLKLEKAGTQDLSSECCEFLSHLMLAQAQECFYEKAHLDGKSASVMAMIAKQASILYQEVKQLYNEPLLYGYFDKVWGIDISVKSVMWEAESFRQSSLSFDETVAVGSKICRLRECKALLDEIKKDAKMASPELAEQFKLVRQQVSEDLQQAEKDNNTVYLSRISLPEELPTIKPAPLAKPIQPDFSSISREEEWFADLVPKQSALALVDYNKLADDLVVGIRQQIENYNGSQAIKLAAFELPMLLDALKPGSMAGLPDKTKDQIQEFQDTGGIGYIKTLLIQIAELRKQCEDQLTKCEDKLSWEVQQDRKHRELYESKWSCPPSHSANKVLSDKIANYQLSLLAGSESDSNAVSTLKQYEDEGLQTALSTANLTKTWPLLQARPSASNHSIVSDEVAKIVKEMNTLEKQRMRLLEATQQLRQSDNILPLLMKQNGGYDDVFERELEKYTNIRKDVETSCERTQQLILQLDQSMVKFKNSFQISEWKQARELSLQNVEKHVINYQQIRDKLQQSLESYQSLLDVLKKLYLSCEEFVQSRQIDADKRIEELRVPDEKIESPRSPKGKENEAPSSGKKKSGCQIQ